MELVWGRLREKLSKRYHTSSSRTTSSEWTDAAKDTPPTPATPSGEEDDISQRVYNLPIPSRKSLPDDYERNNNNDNEKYKKVAQRTLHPRPLLPPVRQMIVTRGITNYPSLPERRFLTTMNVTTMTTKNNKNSREEESWS